MLLLAMDDDACEGLALATRVVDWVDEADEEDYTRCRCCKGSIFFVCKKDIVIKARE